MSAIFPFVLHAEETPHFTSSNYDFRPTFLANRPKEQTWFAYDVHIKSPTTVTFVVYDIRSHHTGGIGDEIGTFNAIVPIELTRKFIERRARQLALQRRELELLVAERAIVSRYADEILASLELETN